MILNFSVRKITHAVKIFFVICVLATKPSYAAPIVSSISAVYTNSDLIFNVYYQNPDNNYNPYEVGGWDFQIFLDTDQMPTGYARGYDFVVQGWEPEPDGSIPVQRTLGGGSPGGWGETVGSIPLSIGSSFFTIGIPLSLLDNDDGLVDYQLCMLDVVAAPDMPLGVTNILHAAYDGTSSPVPEPSSIVLLCAGISVAVYMKRRSMA